MGQTSIVGLIFLLAFSAYYMLQGYASVLFGEKLASNALVALYAVFTVGCFAAPGVVNYFGGKRSLAFGVFGYGVFAAAAFVYAATGEPAWSHYLVIGAGAVNGAGAAVLWTAQGRILLDTAARSAEHDVGALFGVFWGIFNASAVLGGFVTFFYFSQTTSSGNAPLYLVFTALIAAGGGACLLLEDDAPRGAKAVPAEEGGAAAAGDDDEAALAPLTEARATLALFTTRRAAALFLIFFYTGFSQPYRLDGFGDRFFRKRIIGLQLAAYYVMEMIGGVLAGRALDNTTRSKRTNAYLVLSVFVVVTALAFGAGGVLEYNAKSKPDAAPTKVGLNSWAVLAPTATFLLWGFSDSQIQSYTYWLIGALYPTDAKERTRMIGFFKLTQSLGWCIGFAIVPAERCSDFVQLLAQGACFVLGTLLALLELPSAAMPGASLNAPLDAPLLGEREA